MPNLTDKQKTQIKQQIYQEIREFIDTKDYDGFHHYFRKKLDDVDHDTGNRDLNDKNMFRKNCIISFMEENGKQPDPETEQFIHNFMLFSYIMEHTRIMETSKTYEEIKTRLQNGEVKDTELIADNEKTVEKLALGLSVNASPAGRKMVQAKGIVAAMTQALSKTPGYQKLSSDLKKEFEDYLEKDGTYQIQDSKKYRILFKDQAPIDVEDTGLSGAQARFKINLSKDDLSFTAIPDGISQIKEMNIEQLTAYHAEVMKQRDAMQVFEQAGRQWGDTATALLSDLENELNDQKNDPAFKPMFAALKNASSVGKGEYSFGENYMSTARRLSHRSCTFTFNDVISNAEKIKDKAPELAGKIIAKAQECQKAFNESFTAGADKVFDKYSDNATQAQVKMLDKRIVRIEKQLLYKKMFNLDPLMKKRLDSRREGIGSIDIHHDKMRQLLADTKDIAMVSGTVKDFLDNDLQTRGDLTKGNHTKYHNLIKEINKLHDLKNKDLKSMNYKQIMDTLTAARDAAKDYVDSHDGILNIGSGWGGKGRSRIGNAKYIYQKLDRQIKEMKENYDKLFKTDAFSLGEREVTLLDIKNSLRRENASDIKKTATALDEQLFNSCIQDARTKLESAKQAAGADKYPDKNEMAEHLATILTIETAREQTKNGAYGANERKLGLLKNNIRKSQELAEMMKAHTAEELLSAACNRQNPKALSDLFAKKQPQAEKVKQPAKGL
ncbi:MAG: hypothetical protein K6E75_13625 [Lachnospiraceae bacterium]|nr:hypothetical protein [Lachnospiraceae bacterium]